MAHLTFLSRLPLKATSSPQLARETYTPARLLELLTVSIQPSPILWLGQHLTRNLNQDKALFRLLVAPAELALTANRKIDVKLQSKVAIWHFV